MLVGASGGNSNVAVERLGWDELSRQAKLAENSIDSRLLTLGRLTSAALRSHRYDGLRPPNESPLHSAETLAGEVQGDLARLAELVDALASRSQEEAAGTVHILQRHRDIYSEYSKEFRKTKVPFRQFILRKGTSEECARAC